MPPHPLLLTQPTQVARRKDPEGTQEAIFTRLRRILVLEVNCGVVIYIISVLPGAYVDLLERIGSR